MFTKSIIIFLALASVKCHDIAIGDTIGKKIYDETKQANPAIWRQVDNVTVTANDDEVISRVVVKDLRPEKDGDVKIIEGGEGQKNVTLELKSPTALRGYEFQIEVYAVPDPIKDTSSQKNGNAMTNQENEGFNMENSKNPSNINTPILVSKDETNRSARNAMNDKKPETSSDALNNENTTLVPSETLTEIPLEEELNKESMKTAKDAQDHEIVDFVLDLDSAAKEALVEIEKMTPGDHNPLEIKYTSTEEKERISRDISTTEASIESTTNFETTTAENDKDLSENDKMDPINKEFYYLRNWNEENNQDFLKVPFDSVKDETSKTESNPEMLKL